MTESNRIAAAARGAGYIPRPVRRPRDEESGAEFSLGDESDAETEPSVVLEPLPRRSPSGDLPVSQERLADEAGQHLDVRG